MTGPTEVTSLSGSDVRAMFATATAWLERHVEGLNAINVFPVPDGDTGTNMYLTLRSTLDEAYRVDSDRAETMLSAMARGALMGARGNSGVILSQIIRGLAQAAREQQRLDVATLARGLRRGRGQRLQGRHPAAGRDDPHGGARGGRRRRGRGQPRWAGRPGGDDLRRRRPPVSRWPGRLPFCRCWPRRASWTPAARAST